MKKILSLLSIIMVMAFAISCKKSEKSKITGKWEVKTSVNKNYIDGVYKDTETTDYEPNESVIEFKDDNTVASYTFGKLDPETGTYNVDNKTFTSEGFTFHYTLDGNNMTVTTDFSDEFDGKVYKTEIETKLTKQ
jgi:hypothetical protein